MSGVRAAPFTPNIARVNKVELRPRPIDARAMNAPSTEQTTTTTRRPMRLAECLRDWLRAPRSRERPLRWRSTTSFPVLRSSVVLQ